MSLSLIHSGCNENDYFNPRGAWAMGLSDSRMGECGMNPKEGGVNFIETMSTLYPTTPSASYIGYAPTPGAALTTEDRSPYCTCSNGATVPFLFYGDPTTCYEEIVWNTWCNFEYETMYLTESLILRTIKCWKMILENYGVSWHLAFASFVLQKQ